MGSLSLSLSAILRSEFRQTRTAFQGHDFHFTAGMVFLDDDLIPLQDFFALNFVETL